MHWLESFIGNPIGWIKILYNNILVFFGKKHDPKVIPQNTPYCYLPDIEKNKNADKNDTTYYIKACPYYKSLGNGYNGCKFLGVATDDMDFDDQCKICGEGDQYRDIDDER